MATTIMANTELERATENVLATRCGICRIVPKIWDATIFEADQFGWTDAVIIAGRYLQLLRDHLKSSRLVRGG